MTTHQRMQYFRNGIQISPDQALDHRGCLLDGVTARTPLTMRDSGDGHRPGWRLPLTDAANDERETAWQEMVQDAADAWRHLPSRVSDSERHHVEPPDRHQYDGMSTAEISREHQKRMTVLLDEIAREQSNAWRTLK